MRTLDPANLHAPHRRLEVIRLVELLVKTLLVMEQEILPRLIDILEIALTRELLLVPLTPFLHNIRENNLLRPLSRRKTIPPANPVSEEPRSRIVAHLLDILLHELAEKLDILLIQNLIR